MGFHKHFQTGDEEIDPADVARLEELYEIMRERRKNWTAEDYHKHYIACGKITNQDLINDALDLLAIATSFANNMQRQTNDAIFQVLTNKKPEVKNDL